VSAVKWVISAVCGLGGLAAIGWAVLQAPPARAAAERTTARPLELRPFPTMTSGAPTGPPVTEPAGAAQAEAALDAGAAGPGPVAVPAGKPDAGVRVGPPVIGDGTLTLTASATADLYLDGKRIGSSPMQGVKVRSGPHKVRFDCYDAAGNAVTGQVKLVTVVADQELAVTYPCPDSP
jgi:hypothetical protein